MAGQISSAALKAKPMLLSPVAGIRRDSPGPDCAWNSIAPERTCEIMSVEEPSWLPGNTWTTRRPSVSFLMRSAATCIHVLVGCEAGRSTPNL
jgi:hypothetical protein